VVFFDVFYGLGKKRRDYAKGQGQNFALDEMNLLQEELQRVEER
jgi:hypothetical protein